MSKAIVGIAKSTSQVEVTLDDLQNNALIPTSDISVLMPASGETPELGAVKATKAPEGATTGAVTGGAIGGTVGLLAGIGALAIPGLGPFIAAGPIMAALSGAAAGATAGGLVGALVGLGIPEYEAKAYEDRIKKGGYLLAVHVEDSENGNVVRDIMKNNGLEDISSVSVHEKKGLHRVMYRWSPEDYRELDQIWNGPHPEDGQELIVKDEILEGAPWPEFEEEPQLSSPGAIDPDMIKHFAKIL